MNNKVMFAMAISTVVIILSLVSDRKQNEESQNIKNNFDTKIKEAYLRGQIIGLQTYNKWMYEDTEISKNKYLEFSKKATSVSDSLLLKIAQN